jgi:hypothetical protein
MKDLNGGGMQLGRAMASDKKSGFGAPEKRLA